MVIFREDRDSTQVHQRLRFPRTLQKIGCSPIGLVVFPRSSLGLVRTEGREARPQQRLLELADSKIEKLTVGSKPT